MIIVPLFSCIDAQNADIASMFLLFSIVGQIAYLQKQNGKLKHYINTRHRKLFDIKPFPEGRQKKIYFGVGTKARYFYFLFIQQQQKIVGKVILPFLGCLENGQKTQNTFIDKLPLVKHLDTFQIFFRPVPQHTAFLGLIQLASVSPNG